MNRKKALSIVTVFLIIIILLVVFINKAPVSIRIGYLPIASHLPIYIAKQEKMFDKQNVNVKLVPFKDSATLVSAVINDDIDIAYECGTDVALNAMIRDKNSFKIYQIAISKENEPLDAFLAPINSDLTSFENFLNIAKKHNKKIKIGVFPGPTARAFVNAILDKYLEKKKFNIEIISIPPGQPQLDALKMNKIDLLFTYDPFISYIISKEAGKKIISGPVERYLVNPWPGGIGIISTRFLSKAPSTAKKVIESIYKAFDFVENNKKRTRQYLTEFSNISYTVAEKVNYTSHIKINTDFDRLILSQYMEKLINWGIINKRVELENAYISIIK